MRMTGVVLTIGLSAVFGGIFMMLEINHDINYSYLTRYPQLTNLGVLLIAITAMFSIIFYIIKRVL